MRILITGVCGFVGSRVAQAIQQSHPDWSICGLDNFSRPGSRRNRPSLERLGIDVLEADLRDRELTDKLSPCEWVIDCAANPSVLAGVTTGSSSLDVMEHNLVGTIHLLEYCKTHQAGLILVSTSRVYSASKLAQIPVELQEQRYQPTMQVIHSPSRDESMWAGLTADGINERFSTEPPLSLYGSSKLASELLAMEYASAFDFPLWINRCGVMAGAGQFGKADQGIVAFWIHSWFENAPLKYVGFDGFGHQVRDCLHPGDLSRLIELQVVDEKRTGTPRICNVSGGCSSAFSLRELSDWCEHRWPNRRPRSLSILSDFRTRPYDCPWIVLDSSLAQHTWSWRPEWDREAIWNEIADHAEAHPDWLDQIKG
ncbi:MAG: NAD-dependent epimerase/dehydratase family protein [Pirellula sp.]|jgi:CDP-paratose 2-epimerase|nr:NAD-dependent epimerase/dehydratase family protein [Pirellula sp.]